MEFLWFALIGVAAGWLAGQIMKGGSGGFLADLIVGVIGSIFGGVLFRAIGLASVGLVGQLITATVGAVVLLVVLRMIKRG